MYEPSFYLLKEARKSWEHVISDEVIYALDRFIVRRNAHGVIPKDYFEGNLWFESHLTFVSQGHANHLLLLVECCDGQQFGARIRKPKRELLAVDSDPSMLVDVAHTIEKGETMCRGIRPVVWLKRFDDALCDCGYSRRVLFKLRPVSRGVVVEDRELSMRGISEAHSDFGKRPDRLIEGRPQTIKKITGDKRYLNRRIGENDANPVDLPFHIVLTPDSYRLGFKKGIDPIPQRIQVYLRPGCLQIGVGQRNAVISA